MREPVGCTNFCISDKNLIGDFPAICDEGDIDCVHCNGVGSCNADGACECEEGYTGDFVKYNALPPMELSVEVMEHAVAMNYKHFFNLNWNT